MEDYHRDEPKTPDKPYNPLENHLEVGKMKHCDLFDRCIDSCNDCLFNTLYHLNPKPGEAPNQWNGDLYGNEY